MAEAPDSLACVCLTGPTACGKTGLAIELAERYGAEIVSMDSALVYRGMDIGTAKPARDVLERVPHHLIDIREPENAYSAGQFAADALAAISSIVARGRPPLVVGGTLLYLRALRDGFADLPSRDERVRAAIDAEAAERGWPALHAELHAVDPVAAGRIEPADRQRIQRALEVYRLTRKPISALQAAARAVPQARVLTIAIVPGDRQALARRIAARFDAMLGAGLLDEVSALRERPGLSARSASMRSVGYRQLWAHLDGRGSLAEARERAIVATRQLAKRQMTWLRADERCISLELESADLGRQVGTLIERFDAKSGKTS
jgi:tRNA dimethylallyltransferase